MPTAVAEIFDKAGEHTLILNTRCQMIYPFSAPNWVDLRVGFFLSVCSTAVDDPASPIVGLAETLVPGTNPPAEFWWLGVKTNNDLLPTSFNTGFIGYSGGGPGFFSPAADLVSSDAGIGTTNSNFWRPRVVAAGGPNNAASAVIMDGNAFGGRFDNVNSHFAQVWDGTPTHPYATLLMLRIQRPDPASHSLTVKIKQGTNSGDVVYSNTPSLDLLETNLSNYPTVVQTKANVHMTSIPDALYLYWPFHNSRLRVHAVGFMKYH